MSEDGTFTLIREEVARDLSPVAPLRPAWVGALVVLPLAFLLLTLLLLLYGLRSDASSLGFWALWGPTALMLFAAYGIVYLALVQRAPESTVSSLGWLSLPLVAIGLQLAGSLFTLAATEGTPAGVPLRAEAMCFLRIFLLSVPALLVALWLLSRGLPLRPRIAGLLAGFGVGFLSEGIYRLNCSLSSPAHIIPWHTGAVVVSGVLGLLAGLWWERRRLNHWIEERA